jgi:hypothetical protein
VLCDTHVFVSLAQAADGKRVLKKVNIKFDRLA